MTIVQETQDQLKAEIKAAIIKAELAPEEQIPTINLEKPKEKAHGDYATNIAMQLARIAKKAPRQIAEQLVAKLDQVSASVTKIEIAGPGFINFFMDNSYLTRLIPVILNEADQYGRTQTGLGESVQIEFVSANPTGDLHLGHARGASVGDSIANLLDAAGFQVEREFYINDAGNQMNNLALSIEARYMQALDHDFPMPEDGYHGKDIVTIAEELIAEHNDAFVEKTSEERLAFFREYGLAFELAKLKKDLAEFRVDFDHWFSETSLYQEDKIEPALFLLKQRGYTFEEDNAIWFRTTDFGDDKDRVLIKNDGSYTYLAPDIAYHKNKLDRGFKKLINIWGADHHGYIPRMKAAIQALGYGEDTLEVEIIQMVNLFENGEKVKMSKRTGKAVTLRELMDEVGIDAMRYFFVMRSSDAHLDFDMDLAKSESNENPVYYVQYAHARICTLLKQAKEKGYELDLNYLSKHLMTEKAEDLLKQLGDFPQVIADAAVNRAPHRMTQYVFDLAALLHSYYNAEKVLDPNDPEKTKARLALMQAVKITIANGLKLIGVQAPNHM
ncbi:arginine--tRNA ligase [Amphibacillus sp. Q70]|uniref:arginine--tRNA ligase n=1 Tax=Amphibacillus sp. Q70 TaxID=3453416 RepID=UPI003F833373